MQNETDFKNAFCDSVSKQGGYTFKIAMSTMRGLPDIYCAMPGYIPLLLEGKYIKDLPEGKFSRKIKYRPLQREILISCNKVYSGMYGGTKVKVAYCLMGIDLGNKKYCTLLDPEVQVITHDLVIKETELVPIEEDILGQIHIGVLFDKCGISRKVSDD